MGYFTINIRSNRVVIISSVITRIFLTLCNAWTATFQPVSIKTLMIYLCVHSAHVPVISCSIYFCCLIYFIVVRLLFEFCSSLVRLFFSFNSFVFHCSLFIVQRKKNSILILDCIPSISIPLYVKYLFIIIYASQMNMIHQTAPTLS